MKIINESIDNIFVNPENPRHNPTLDDITALNELIKDGQEDMIELINSINEFGFFPQKVVSLIEKNNKKIAIDGNRRIAAIKCALNPENIIDKRFRGRVERIKLNKIAAHMEIPCVLYDNIQEVLPFILAEHTEGGQTKKWSRIQQCYFMLKYGSREDVPEIFLLYYDNFTREYNSSIENLSTIERIAKKKNIERLKKLDVEILKNILMQFVVDTNKHGGKTSRTFNKKEEGDAYFEDIISRFVVLPSKLIQSTTQSQPPTQRTQFNLNQPQNLVNPAASNKNTITQADTTILQKPSYTSIANGYNVRPLPTSHAFKSLKWTGLDTDCPMTKSIIDVAKEVKALAKSFDNFPIATTIIIRTLLDLSLKYWLSTRHSNRYNYLVNNARGKAKDPQLSDIIDEIRKQIQNHNVIFDIHIDGSFVLYFAENDVTMKDKMDVLVHRPWDLGTHANLYKFYEEDFIYTLINYILNTK